MNLAETDFDNVDWSYRARDLIQRWSFVMAVLNFRVAIYQRSSWLFTYYLITYD
jgi:hypothetical protein